MHAARSVERMDVIHGQQPTRNHGATRNPFPTRSLLFDVNSLSIICAQSNSRMSQ
jgi:hypothetical protein